MSGDPVCWLDQLCPECGALTSRSGPTPEFPERCWRCGTPRADGDRDASHPTAPDETPE